ncbi:MAG: hypothetical protein KAJ98_05410 [Spirochaetaceae bacterium]|nr:hypothetical protein [Spirochaetaceae bacterium]
MGKKYSLFFLILILMSAGCQTGSYSKTKIAEDAAWALIYQLSENTEDSVIAVYSFKEDGEESRISTYFENALPTALVAAIEDVELDLTVVSRSKIDQILQESEFQRSGLVNESEQIRIGQFLGADYIITGTIDLNYEAEDYTEFTLIIQVLDVEEGSIIGGYQGLFWVEK